MVEVQGLRIVVEEAPAWNDLFKRYTGWTGADGIYAIPLSGYEGPGRAGRTKTLLVFGDTFIGRVDADGARQESVLVNNTLAVLEGGRPDPGRIRFIWGENADGSPGAALQPDTPRAKAAGEAWYWLQDGVCLHGNMYFVALLIGPNPAGPRGFKFKALAACLIKVPVHGGGLDLSLQTQYDTPLYDDNEERRLSFGAGTMPNTEDAGAPNPDGYVYVYGRYEPKRIHGRAQLAVARVGDTDFEDVNAWRFWDGTTWSPVIADAAPLGLGGPELSVTPVANGPLGGKYLMVSMHVERDLYIRIGESPVGPFGPRIDIYHTREPGAGQEIYTYNAKAHPNLSTPKEWLISYNVNSTGWEHHMRNADIYRPRFLRVRFEPASK